MYNLKFYALLLFIALSLALPVRAQNTSLDFGPLRSLVGFCWIAEIEAEADEPTQSFNTHCFEAMFDGQFIRDRHSFSNQQGAPVEGESIYKLDGGGNLVITNLSAVGGIKTASAEVVDSDTLIYLGENGTRSKERFRLVLISPDSYVLITEERKSRDWHEMSRIEFFRAKRP